MYVYRIMKQWNGWPCNYTVGIMINFDNNDPNHTYFTWPKLFNTVNCIMRTAIMVCMVGYEKINVLKIATEINGNHEWAYVGIIATSLATHEK